ncbi:MAG: NAD(P)/FAD-dependent oxidoreductase [Bacilli bacterium]|nr:NAD(P)/FAD-dependent oxidoreductase [Bacilli bacterium]
MFDVLIIGAGVTGAFIARNLAKYQLKVALLDKENDVGNLTSNANSAIIHSGYDPVPGTLKAKFNVLGNQMYDQIADELDVHFYRYGSLTVATEESQLPMLQDLARRSAINGVPVELLSAEKVKEMEPNITPEVKGALFAPTAGIIDPFNLVVHCVENAVDNGVKLFLNEEVVSISKSKDIFLVVTKKNNYEAKVVINAAGAFSDKIASLFEGEIDWHIIPRKGEYFVLDHYSYDLVKHTIFPLPSAKGKGILVSPTSSYNYIVGPSSEEVESPDDYQTDKLTLDNVRKQATNLIPSIPFNQVIRVFSGVRPTPSTHDFIIRYSQKDNHFIHAAGIESPGLVSAPAIGEYVVEELVRGILPLEKKENYNPRVKKYKVMHDMTLKEQEEVVKEDPSYGQIICNCEHIPLGQIQDCLSRSVPPRSVKGVKRRVRAGYGKCQGGFCQPSIVLLLAKHYGISPLEVPYDQEKSPILMEKVKEVK